jgi:AcrR family transcriptional regulator
VSLKAGAVRQRRRGRALEAALLDAAWAELMETGYDGFTIDAAATRAGAYRTVLYRRWPGKQQLVHAAIAHAVDKNPLTPPDTGSLRGDVIAMLHQANQQRVRTVTILTTRLGEFYRATNTSPADLAAVIHGGREPIIEGVIQRAVARGEILPGQVSQRIARLPGDLFRYEVLMGLRPLGDETIEEIVDTIFLPLVHTPSAPKAQN